MAASARVAAKKQRGSNEELETFEGPLKIVVLAVATSGQRCLQEQALQLFPACVLSETVEIEIQSLHETYKFPASAMPSIPRLLCLKKKEELYRSPWTEGSV